MAREAGRSLERAIDSVDLDAVANVIGVDPTMAREWAESASSWLREQTDNLGEEVASRVAESRPTPFGPKTASAERTTPPSDRDAFSGASPHPLDLATEEQGLALSALASGRWTVEPGTGALGAIDSGPAPTNAAVVTRELRARDWITSEGEITIVGRHALSRWLDVAAHP